MHGKEKAAEKTTLNQRNVTGGLPRPLHGKVTLLPLTANGTTMLSVNSGASRNNQIRTTCFVQNRCIYFL